MAHRLELAIFQVQKKVAMVSVINDVLQRIWKTYHYSPKSLRELRSVSEEFETRFLVEFLKTVRADTTLSEWQDTVV